MTEATFPLPPHFMQWLAPEPTLKKLGVTFAGDKDVDVGDREVWVGGLPKEGDWCRWT